MKLLCLSNDYVRGAGIVEDLITLIATNCFSSDNVCANHCTAVRMQPPTNILMNGKNRGKQFSICASNAYLVRL